MTYGGLRFRPRQEGRPRRKAKVIGHARDVRLEWNTDPECGEGRLLIATQVTRQEIVEVLRTTGLPEAADDANRSLPEQLDMERAAEFLGRYGITKDALISRMGGSP